ncbi:MAG: hypothetical protein PHN22_04800 [Candidatus ainarchaeum sp.]|nr:hypothetical protein [Candidatus ainarchaeum sp.]
MSELFKIFAPIYAVIGLIIAILDSLDIFRLTYFTSIGLSCALNSNLTCVTTTIEKILLFGVDVTIGPILLFVWILQNIWWIIVLILVGVIIYGLIYIVNNL